MKPYFADITEREKFREILRSWEGTPYRHFTKMKGRGADCTLFIAGALEELGILLRTEYEYYPRDWHLNCHTELVLEYFDKHFMECMLPGLSRKSWSVPPATAGDIAWGDIITFSTTKMGVSNHAALYLDHGEIINCLNGRGVCVIPFAYGKYLGWKLTNIFRLCKVDK